MQKMRTRETDKRVSSLIVFQSTEVSVDEVLFDVREFPLTRDEFQKYLASRHAEENLHFWLVVQKFKEGRLHEVTMLNGKEVRVLKEPVDVESVLDSRSIVENYIGDRAKLISINLSHELTEELLSSPAEGLGPKFNEAQREVRGMLSGDMFYRFLSEKLTTNISTSEAGFRSTVGFVTFIFVSVLGVLLKLVASPHPFPPYAVFLVTLPGTWAAVYFFFSGTMKTCAGKGLTGKVMPGDATWMQGRGLATCSPRELCNKHFYDGMACDLKVKDAAARRKLRWKSYKLIAIMTIGGLVESAIIGFAIPSLSG